MYEHDEPVTSDHAVSDKYRYEPFPDLSPFFRQVILIAVILLVTT